MHCFNLPSEGVVNLQQRLHEEGTGGLSICEVIPEFFEGFVGGPRRHDLGVEGSGFSDDSIVNCPTIPYGVKLTTYSARSDERPVSRKTLSYPVKTRLNIVP